MKFKVTIFLTALSFIQLHAQNDSSMKVYPVQFSVIPPLSTNGAANAKMTNNFSFNLFAGYSGGLNGLEIGGFANIVKDSVQGAQISGFTNVVGGKTKGLQMAGFTNINQKNVQGIQMAGFTNVVNDSVDAIQLAGFSNVVRGSLKGLQAAGFLNMSGQSSQGAQISGFLNLVHGKMQGAQIAGFYNMATDSIQGAQVAGFMNVSTSLIHGGQVSGFINAASRLNGSQIGFLNFVDSLESGTPFGFLSFVRKGGYTSLELSGDETFYGNLSFKTGSKMFYNILSVSARTGSNFYWGFGYGVGSHLKSNGKFNINLDLTATQINRNEFFTQHLNLLSRAKLGFTWKAAKHLSISAGPTFNILTIYKSNIEGIKNLPTAAPYSVYDEVHSNTRIQMWPGAHLSIRF